MISIQLRVIHPHGAVCLKIDYNNEFARIDKQVYISITKTVTVQTFIYTSPDIKSNLVGQAANLNRRTFDMLFDKFNRCPVQTTHVNYFEGCKKSCI